MIRLEWLFLMQLVMGILMFVFLQKINHMKKQMDKITKEVMDYISYVTEAVEEEQKETIIEEKQHPKTIKKEQEEAQNRLIQAVLGDYFI